MTLQDPATRIHQLGEKISRYRSMRPKPRRMPEILWAEAVALARELGVYRVVSALGLNYNALRERLEQTPSPARPELQGAVNFVELSGAQMLGPRAGPGPVVELVESDGARLSVRLPVGSVVDLPQLVAAYRGGRG